MLADDEGIVLDSLKMIIDKNFPDQCQIETAKTGRDVIELAESFRPDIAFMDIQMPGINGIDAIREIQKSNPSVEFIVLSAYDKFDYAKEAINLGVLDYVNKPFSARVISEVLTKAMKVIDSRRKKRSDDLRIKEKMETVTPIIENGFVYSIMFQEYVTEDVDNYRQLLGIQADYGCMLALVNSTGSVAHVDDLPIQCRYDEEYPIDLERALFDCLRSGTSEECERMAGRYFDWMIDTYDEKNMSVRLKTLEFVLWAEHEAYLNGGLTYHFEERENYLPLIMGAKNNSELRGWFVEKFGEANRNMCTRKEEHENQLVRKAQNYIQENYQKDLSLDEVSRQLDLSPYYFSKLFKEETGSNFVEYVTNLRIARAKELLAGDGCSMKEICAEVGYSDPNYFSRIFKKNVGVTPTEYRENERG